MAPTGFNTIKYTFTPIDSSGFVNLDTSNHHVQSWDRTSGSNEHWEVEYVGSTTGQNFYTFRNMKNGEYAGFDGDAKKDTPLIGKSTITIFELLPIEGSDDYRIKVPYSSFAWYLPLDVTGKQIVLRSLTKKWKSPWKFTPVPEDGPVFNVNLINSVKFTNRYVDLDATNGEYSKVLGYYLGQGSTSGNSNQHWDMEVCPPELYMDADWKFGTLKNIKTGTYAGFEGDASDGKLIIAGKTSTIFEFVPAKTGYHIKVPYSAFAWSLADDTNGTQIKLAALDKDDEKQQFTLKAVS